MPIQVNFDENYGTTEEGSVLRINVQPVIPFSLNDDWNLISRTIVPIVDQNDFESTYDWETEDWSVPLNLSVSQLMMLGDQAVQIGGGIRYWITAPENGPDDWGLRFNVKFLFPK